MEEINSNELVCRISELIPSELFDFLEDLYRIDKEKNPGKEQAFLYYFLDIIEVHDNFLLNSRKKLIWEWIEKKKNEIQVSEIPVKQGEKIKWNGTPSQFGYLFLELVKNGFIEPPLYNGDPNYTGFARLCFQYFEINTTPGNLEKEMNPNKNTLSDTKRLKFPNLSDLD